MTEVLGLAERFVAGIERIAAAIEKMSEPLIEVDPRPLQERLPEFDKTVDEMAEKIRERKASTTTGDGE